MGKVIIGEYYGGKPVIYDRESSISEFVRSGNRQ